MICLSKRSRCGITSWFGRGRSGQATVKTGGRSKKAAGAERPTEPAISAGALQPRAGHGCDRAFADNRPPERGRCQDCRYGMTGSQVGAAFGAAAHGHACRRCCSGTMRRLWIPSGRRVRPILSTALIAAASPTLGNQASGSRHWTRCRQFLLDDASVDQFARKRDTQKGVRLRPDVRISRNAPSPARVCKIDRL